MLVLHASFLLLLMVNYQQICDCKHNSEHDSDRAQAALAISMDLLEIQLKFSKDFTVFDLPMAQKMYNSSHKYNPARKALGLLREFAERADSNDKPCSQLELDLLVRVYNVRRFSSRIKTDSKKRRRVDVFADKYGEKMVSKCLLALENIYVKMSKKLDVARLQQIVRIGENNFQPKLTLDDRKLAVVKFNYGEYRNFLMQLADDNDKDNIFSKTYTRQTWFQLETYGDLLRFLSKYLYLPCKHYLSIMGTFGDYFESLIAYYPYTTQRPSEQTIREQFFDKLPARVKWAAFTHWLCKNHTKFIFPESNVNG